VTQIGPDEAGRLPQRCDDRADEAGTLQRQLDEAHTEILFDTKFMPNVLEILFRPMIAIGIATFACQKGGYLMKRALIGTIGVVALIAGVQDAYAQARPAGSSPGWEWYASVGPVRRGNQCVQDVDINRGYGFLKNCPAPQAAARRPARVARR
jgi:hypothetical protein